MTLAIEYLNVCIHMYTYKHTWASSKYAILNVTEHTD